jgi:Xaa-Pro aminopeptidase
VSQSPSLDDDKRARLDALLDERGLAAVWFARPNSFAWLTGGDSVVSREADVGVAAAGYLERDDDGRQVCVLTDTIEAPRLREEELPGSVAVTSEPWYETSLGELVAGHSPRPAAADVDVPGLERVDASTLRQPLTAAERERYRELAGPVATAVEAVARDTTSGETERAVAARLRGRLAEEGIDAPVALVGGSERATQYRHYTPTPVAVGDYALLSVTAVRDGLHVSTTRTVAFDPPSWLDERTRAAARVEASALAATRAVGRDGGTAGDVFDAIREAYAAVGFEGEWRNHHQGGAGGYAGREWIATPDSDATVHLPMAYAWNPTVQGAKSEDTHLVAADGIETVSTTGDWPTVAVEAVGYDVTLERPAPLQVG